MTRRTQRNGDSLGGYSARTGLGDKATSAAFRLLLLRLFCAGSLVALLLWSLWDAFAPDPCQFVDGAWNRSGCETAPPSRGGIP